MRDSSSGILVGLAVILCCALPLLLLSGILVAGGGFFLNQQVLIGLGILVVLIVGLFWRFMRRKR
jgi:hypothetical protein